MVQFEKQNPEESEQTKLLDYEKIVVSKEFQQMISDKKKFVIPFTIFFMGYSLLLPFLVFYTDILDHPFIGDITWAWVYGVSITVMSVGVCSIYVRKSERIDEQIKKIIEKEGL
ncbi:DUF485 domain-containing protein [Peribacillus simplex]|jgi:uncharacterized membrane protein (DUF485 family)|uniref:DUF485 domain-containing protein n=1 Tax=Peribacillus simplex TaxID=1478 RepID=A0AAW7IF86_9BACI|nr:MULTISPECIES: DUF485 domain-containing protein [Peribacillus]SNT23303.1 Uncharacterized membrane protein, DUF485 family [Bacillus sp. OK838]AMM93650.1 hypothetical protein UP17_15210 [Peribacillus simplex]MDF9760809.1 uncharacterized membrane protein (DUF485 family) [Peribacillus simplex]MDM5294148.1 DUF485 domain-containing protein [Peribacillus simplex]MDM5453089.1 DUF485 domain-containing protein [Peribacillus simplex]